MSHECTPEDQDHLSTECLTPDSSVTAIDSASTPSPSPLNGFRQNRSLWVGLGLGLAIGVGIGSTRLFSLSSPAAAEAEQSVSSSSPAQTVTVAIAESTPIDRTLAATGTVAPYDLLPVAPRTSGLQIRQVLVDEGDRVTAGQVLAILDDSVIQAQIAEAEADLVAKLAQVEQQHAALTQAEATLAEAETNRDRYTNLYDEGVISRQETDSRETTAITARESVRVAQANILSAEAEVRSQQALIDQLQTQLEQTLVIAPADGIVAERMARVGDVSSPSQPLFSVIRDRRLELQVKLPETQLPQVRIGSAVQITSDADPRIQLRGQVRDINPMIDPDTREATVNIDLPVSDLLRSGMFLRAGIVASTSQGITVPAAAVLPQPDGSSLVYRVVGEQVEAQPVIPGEWLNSADIANARIEIVEGLTPGARVVVDGASYLKEGDRILISP